MPEDNTSEQPALSAGDFSPWLVEISEAIRGERASDVPCNGCTACCTSSQFIHIGPDETDTLAHIPSELLFPAPLLPRGHVLMGYDARGHCPMLIDNRCSIYEHRPRTCRTYDCRIFPAAGLPVDESQPLIAQRAQRWEFSYPSEDDRNQHAAVQAATAFLRDHASLFPVGAVPANTIQLSVLAVQIHDLFLRRDEETGRTVVAEPDSDKVRAEVMRLVTPRPESRPRGRRRP